MNYLAVIRALLSGWWIIAGATLLGAGASLVVTSVTPPTYEASTSYYVSVAGDTSATAGEIAQGSTAAQQKIKSYMQLATSPRVLQGVVDELDLDVTPAALASQVTASVDAGTVIIKIAVQDGSAKAAATIAEQIGKSLATVVQEIEPAGADQAPSVRLEEVTPASRPLSPIAPRKTADLALGLLGGLAAGAALALLRAAVDTRVRSSEDLDGDVPVVGDIAFDADAGRHPLIIRDEVNSARSEAFRSLRTNIQFLRTSGAPTIAVTSARPSEGKTTTTANLGIALSKSGMRTVIIDADLRRPNVAAVMSLEGAVGLTDLLVGRVELDDVLQDWGLDGLSVLPAGTIPPEPQRADRVRGDGTGPRRAGRQLRRRPGRHPAGPRGHRLGARQHARVDDPAGHGRQPDEAFRRPTGDRGTGARRPAGRRHRPHQDQAQGVPECLLPLRVQERSPF
ncbi:Wzz/FepE/Etk N-terminal domain-containing protein [Curtobacterium flaccumfaciens pv. flaccumfaciens]